MYALTQMSSRTTRISHLLALLVRDRPWKSSVTSRMFRVRNYSSYPPLKKKKRYSHLFDVIPSLG